MTHLRWWPRWCAVFGLVIPALVVGVPSAQAGPPTDALRDFFGAVNVVLNDPRTADQPLEKLRAIRRHVDDVFDFREATILALGREWTARTPLEQNEFVALFADLLERSFVWRVAGKASLGGGVKVDYLGETANGDTATVDTAVAARDGNDLRLGFRMVRRAERWVVRDVVMDGVSTMENYHAQFQRIVRDASWRELVSQLRAKVGAPAVRVAAAAPVAAPPAPTPAPGVTPRPLLDVDRPGTDVPHAIARDVAAVVTPVLVAREAPPPREIAAAPPTTRSDASAGLPPPTNRAPDIASVDVRPSSPRPEFESLATPVVPPTKAQGPAVGSIVGHPKTRVPDFGTVVPAAMNRAPDAGTVVPAPTIRVPEFGTVVSPPTIRAPDLGTAVTPRAHPGGDGGGEAPPPSLWIQVGAFKNATTAGRVATQVKGEILVVAPRAATGGRGEPILRVRVGPFPDRAHAVARLREIRSLGYQPFLAMD